MPLPLGVVKEEVAVLVVLVRRYCCAVGAAGRGAVDGDAPGAVEKKTGPAAVRRVPSGLLFFPLLVFTISQGRAVVLLQ